MKRAWGNFKGRLLARREVWWRDIAHAGLLMLVAGIVGIFIEPVAQFESALLAFCGLLVWSVCTLFAPKSANSTGD